MKAKQGKLKMVLLLVSCFTSAAMACCGNCHYGEQKMYKSSVSLSHKDSISAEKFAEGNRDLIEKLENNKKLITEAYQKKNPDYDKIAELKKQGVDYHTELEKRASKENIPNHRCWCPMHK